MNKTYFIWIALHAVVWPLTFLGSDLRLTNWHWLSLCIYCIILFIIPVFINNPLLLTVLFSIQVLPVFHLFYASDATSSPYLLLIHGLIVAEALFRLTWRYSIVVLATHSIGVISFLTVSTLPQQQVIWIGLFYLLLITGLVYFQMINTQARETRRKNDALLDEYRRMKRQLVTEEEQARQDERMLIGHEIHDSVGHKLTALLMQLEAFRLTVTENEQGKVAKLKELADQSLKETRRAVKSFKQNEVGGLQGLIRLIRKLEVESFMNVNFSVKHGAFAAGLSGEQSFAIYRAVQEALTNIMKHSSTREAHITFEAPGGSIFRFEVVNPTKTSTYFTEGYGLKAMRHRLEKAGGSLEIDHDERHFIVRGTIRLTKTERVE
ncbi:sensor histidine kinase [Gracilibacillus sp. S3-1-1]|uniref:Sensor histidine kinase n=1 Tax=Gracilibacillus pellucidus TaxID=3095368 RepID=A0ACC6M3T1_9BACI|nr:sensor histidine kinase [Gracilibacillus sp. S3-1-1]MDX8045596.1 sensor histidine kinase [Gracilibacillus sp. S3-1-1]